MLNWQILAAAAISLCGCASTPITPVPVGGSRADGTVEMAYEFGAFQNPQVDYTAAQIQAEQRCAAWGYTAAEKFGGEKRMCSVPTNSGCMGFQVSVNYQCTGLTQKQ